MTDHPFFWSSLFLLILIGWEHWRLMLLREQVSSVLDHEQQNTKYLATMLDPCGEKSSNLSLQSDTNVHHEWELIRLRESVIELACDLQSLSEAQYIVTTVAFSRSQAAEIVHLISDANGKPARLGTRNRVLERHTQLPEDLPAAIKEQYETGKWTCPICESEIANSWTGWCATCRRPTATRTHDIEHRLDAESDLEHEPTSPGLGFYEEFTCFACRKIFLLTQHPLAATCPHCGARQIDVAV